MVKVICLAGGCFWGTEHYIGQFDGILETTVGYANGSIASPSYEQVYTDTTGHVECVKVVYDDEMISLGTLCRLYFRSIDPLLLNRQGEDRGTRYRTGIYWSDESDAKIVSEVYEEVRCRTGQALAVEKCALTSFYPAEEYHQDYLHKNSDGYCHLSLETLRLAKTYSSIMKQLREMSTEEKREILPRFFKTGKGEYGEGDKFLGVIVPLTREVAKRHKDVSYEVLEAMLESEWHECRLCALMILIEKYRKGQEEAVRFYLSHTAGINNWDLVDLSAPYILGDYLTGREDRDILYQLAASPVMWEQRIAMVSTLMLIRNGQFSDTLRLAEMFMDTPHDLMRKCTGWMLREISKRDVGLLVDFLERHRSHMPRTMLRYAVERLSPDQRACLMKKKHL